MKTARILLLVTVPALVAAAASIMGMLLTPGLPDGLAAHWGVDGSVDRVDGLGTFIALVAVTVPLVVLLIAAFSYLPLRHGTSRLYARTVVGISTGLGVFLSLSMFLTVWMQRGVTDAASLPASAPVVPLLAGLAAGAVAAVLAILLTPPVPSSPGLGASVTELELGADERAYWARTTHAPRALFVVLAAVLVVLAVVFTISGIPWWVSALTVLLLSALFTMLSWHVVVDRKGLTVTGSLGVPRFRFPLDTITGAAAIDISGMREFGGWGIRVGSSGRWGVIVQSGAAIEVQRRSGANFVVTVDDAATAAGLLTSLARRG